MSTFGAFRATLPSCEVRNWMFRRIKMTQTQKGRQRERLRTVDSVIKAIQDSGVKCAALNVALELPREREMRPKDKYTVFARRYWRHGYRKGMHLVPHYTKVTQRTNPKGF